jgi:hypothetical protein
MSLPRGAPCGRDGSRRRAFGCRALPHQRPSAIAERLTLVLHRSLGELLRHARASDERAQRLERHVAALHCVAQVHAQHCALCRTGPAQWLSGVCCAVSPTARDARSVTTQPVLCALVAMQSGSWRPSTIDPDRELLRVLTEIATRHAALQTCLVQMTLSAACVPRRRGGLSLQCSRLTGPPKRRADRNGMCRLGEWEASRAAAVVCSSPSVQRSTAPPRVRVVAADASQPSAPKKASSHNTQPTCTQVGPESDAAATPPQPRYCSLCLTQSDR